MQTALRSTRTFVTLEVSQSAYDEIKAKLTAADYHHAIVPITRGSGQEVVALDMHGIAIVPPAPLTDEPVLTDEQKAKLNALEVYTGSDPVALMAKIHELFPIKQEMGDNFRGTHSLTTRADGKLQLNIWIAGRVWPVWF